MCYAFIKDIPYNRSNEPKNSNILKLCIEEKIIESNLENVPRILNCDCYLLEQKCSCRAYRIGRLCCPSDFSHNLAKTAGLIGIIFISKA